MYVLVTSYEGYERTLYRMLTSLGTFRSSGFRGVFVGQVEDFKSFMNELEEKESYSVSRVVPIDVWFTFSKEEFNQKLKDSMASLAERMRPGETFSVKVTRRGFKGIFSSQQIASEVGAFVADLLETHGGFRPRVNLLDPDEAILIETAGPWCGMGIVSRSLRTRYRLVRW